MFGRNNQPSNTRLFDFGCWSRLSWSGAVAESVKILSLRLAANTSTVPAQEVDNIGLNLTALAFFMIKANIFNGLNGLFAALCELPF
nr:hypothetical protein [Providencia rettgeri]